MSVQFGKQSVPLKSLIRRAWLDTEMRVRINMQKVFQYAEEMGYGDEFPLPIVFFDTRHERYYVGDGFHRILAKQRNKAKSIEADVRKGDRLDAILCNIEQNKKQKGMPLSFGDLERCIVTLLIEKPEWTQSKIAEFVGSSIAYTSQVVKKHDIARQNVMDKNGRILKLKPKKDRAEVAERRQLVLEKWMEGKPQTDISRELHLSRATVQRDIQEASSNFITCPHCNGNGKIPQPHQQKKAT